MNLSQNYKLNQISFWHSWQISVGKSANEFERCRLWADWLNLFRHWQFSVEGTNLHTQLFHCHRRYNFKRFGIFSCKGRGALARQEYIFLQDSSMFYPAYISALFLVCFVNHLIFSVSYFYFEKFEFKKNIVMNDGLILLVLCCFVINKITLPIWKYIHTLLDA